MQDISLKSLLKEEYEDFVIRNQQAFILAVEDEFGELDEEPISKEDIRNCLNHPLEEAYNIVCCGQVIGGVAVRVDKETNKNSLDLIFVDREHLGKGIGYMAWKKIEELYPDTLIWETHTPHFMMKNIHFYVNKCGFKIVEFFNEYHPEPEDSDMGGVPFFVFNKEM